MSEELNFVKDLAIILISAGIFTIICKALKQPAILGYILAGKEKFRDESADKRSEYHPHRGIEQTGKESDYGAPACILAASGKFRKPGRHKIVNNRDENCNRQPE